MGLLRKIKLIGSKKKCVEACFQYDCLGQGCSYTSYGFEANEKVKPGEKCLYPEWSESQFPLILITDFCNALEARQLK